MRNTSCRQQVVYTSSRVEHLQQYLKHCESTVKALRKHCEKYLNYASRRHGQEKFFILYILPDLWSKLLYYYTGPAAVHPIMPQSPG